MVEYLITGGTGSLGRELTRQLLNRKDTKGIRIYSRDEYKQWTMQQEIDGRDKVGYLIGDVSDEHRLKMAMRGVDVVINTAAMKQVPAAEKNPVEVVKTNIGGAVSVIHAAIENGVDKVLHVSTDKCVSPINTYGATKTVAERLFLNANTYSPNGTGFACVRYGNVLGSRGSVVPLFRKQAKTGRITITHPKMTRFFLPLKDVAEFIIFSLGNFERETIKIPKMKSFRIMDLAQLVAPDCKIDFIGLRRGEKMHEILVAPEEAKSASDQGDFYRVDYTEDHDAEPVRYSSEDVSEDMACLKGMIDRAEIYDY